MKILFNSICGYNNDNEVYEWSLLGYMVDRLEK